MFAKFDSNRFSGSPHTRALWLYLVVVLFHWLEHLCQMYQIYVLGWMPKAAGGVLGLWWPWLVTSEILHVGYNALLWGGLLLLLTGFHERSKGWWRVAFGLQSFHLFEHLLLFAQWIAGAYLFGAAEPTSIGQLWVRRPELHFLYNLAVFIPMMVAVWMHWKGGRPGGHKRVKKQTGTGEVEAMAAA